MKLKTKMTMFEMKLNEEKDFMYRFIFPCSKNGKQLEDEMVSSCDSCDILKDCVDYFSSQPNQMGKIETYTRWLEAKRNYQQSHP